MIYKIENLAAFLLENGASVNVEGKSVLKAASASVSGGAIFNARTERFVSGYTRAPGEGIKRHATLKGFVDALELLDEAALAEEVA